MKHDIPVVCKISLEGQQPPLTLKLSGRTKNDNLNIYASFKDVEPTAKNNFMALKDCRKNLLRFEGERHGPKPG